MRLLGIRILVIPQHIGHHALEPDLWVKERILAGRLKRRDILLAPRDTTANRPLALKWRTYLHVIERPWLAWVLRSFALRAGLVAETRSYQGKPDPDTMTLMGPSRYGEVVRRWGDRPPLLTLDDDERRRGGQVLDELGLPEGAWFVCIQNRTPGFSQQFSHFFTPIHGERRYDAAFRDCSIEPLLPAMEAIVDAGGWCVRVGDETAEPVPAMPGVIDYARLDAKSGWMDLFLCASCRFFVGNTSGLNQVPAVFGAPVVRTNVAPMATMQALRLGDLGIPKLFQLDGRTLSFPEVLGSDVGSYNNQWAFDAAGVTVVENDADDIRDLVVEMLEILDGRVRYSPEDEELQARFQRLIKPHHFNYGGACRVGRGFLRRHRELLSSTV